MNLAIEIKATRNKFGDFRAIELIREAGFDAVDYSFYGYSDESEFLGENYREYAKEVRGKLDEVGLVCNQAHAPFSAFLYGMPFSEEDKNFRDVVRAIESASILGAKCIIVGCFNRRIRDRHGPQGARHRDRRDQRLRHCRGDVQRCRRMEVRSPRLAGRWARCRDGEDFRA